MAFWKIGTLGLLALLLWGHLAFAEVSQAVEPSTVSVELELNITANRYATPTSRSTQQIHVLDQKDLRDSNRDQTPDVVANAPGVLVQKTNYGGGSPFVRGLTGKHVLLMLDGVRLNNSLYRSGPHQYLNTVDPYALSGIEIAYGPSSVLWGTDALGGVINLRTLNPQRYSDEQAYGFGSAVGFQTADRSVRGRVQYYGAVTKSSMVLGASGRSFQDVLGGEGVGRQDHTGYNEFSLDAKLTSVYGPIQATYASYFLRQFDVPKTAEMSLGGKLQYDYEPQIRSLSYVEFKPLDWDVFLMQDLVLNLNVQYHGEGEVVQDAPDANTSYERNDATTFGMFLHGGGEIFESNRVSWGIDFYTDWIASSKQEGNLLNANRIDLKPAFPDGARYTTVGVYLQDEYELFDRVRLVGGGRFSHVRASGELTNPTTASFTPLALSTSDFSGTLGANVQVVQGLYASYHFARGFRAPNMEDFFGKVDFAREIPNTALKAETSLDQQIGLRYVGKCMKANLFGYRDVYRNLIDRVDATDAAGFVLLDAEGQAIQTRDNIGLSVIRGFSFDVEHYGYKYLSAKFNVSYSEGNEISGGSIGAYTLGGPLRRIPPLQGRLSVRLKNGDRYYLEPQLVWAAAQKKLSGGDISDARIGPDGTAGYAVLHVHAGARAGDRGFLRLGLENVADAQYKDHGSGIWFPGRSFYVEYSYGL